MLLPKQSSQTVLAVARFGQQPEVAEDPLVAGEGNAEIGPDIDLSGRLQAGDFGGDLLQQDTLAAEFLRQLQRLLVDDQFALLGQLEQRVRDHGADLGGRQFALGQGQATQFRHQPASFPGIDLFVGPEQVQRRTGVIGLAVQFHADLAAVVLDDLRHQGRRTDMEAPIARHRGLDRAHLGIMLEHGVTQAA
ncbi:MAG: hypothetical protein H6R23_2070, partial [Proteobacteria bacterium]|nr:hypothetical protein [Pseudomonadota bacterium]